MKWFLDPDGIEFSSWNTKALGKHFPNVSFGKTEPVEALEIEGKTLYPLIDEPVDLDEGDYIKSWSIQVDQDAGNARKVYEVAERPREEVIQERLEKASDQCRKRIMAVVDQTAQANMTAFAAAGLFTPEQREVYKAGLLWVAQMRGAWRGLANDRRKSIEADQNWPSPPPDLVELVKQF